MAIPKPLSNCLFHLRMFWLIYVTLFVGVTSVIVMVFVYENDTLFKICLTIAQVCLSSVLITFVTNAVRFLGLFKEDLCDILYLKGDFLKERKDIPRLWKNISKEMVKNKFPDIHDILFGTLSEYFDIDDNYYRDYRIETLLEWVDKNKGIVKSTKIRTYQLCVGDKPQPDYEIETWNTGGEDDVNIVSSELIVDNVLCDNRTITQIDGDRIKQSNFINIEANRTYEISLKVVKTYNIFKDWDITFGSRYITEKLTASLIVPPDIDAHFQTLGTLRDFNKTLASQGRKYVYDGILLPGQGFTFALKVNKIN